MNVLANQKTFYLNCHSLKIKSGYRTFMSDSWLILIALREKCPNTEFFLVRIWTLFTQCWPLIHRSTYFDTFGTPAAVNPPCLFQLPTHSE